MTRSQAVLLAVRLEIERHQAAIDAATDLCTLQITVKLVAGTEQVRGTVWQEERLGRRVGDR